MSRLNFRWRLTLWNALILTWLFAAFGGVMLYLVHGHLQAQADMWLKEELQELIEDVNWSHDARHLQEHLTARYAVHTHHHFRVLNETGEILFQSRFLTNVPIPAPDKPNTLRGSRYENIELPGLGPFRLLNMAMRDPESGVLLLQVVSPRAALRRDFQWYIGTTIAFIPVALIVAILTGYGLARQALSPVESMVATARRISAERLEERLPVPNPRDELGQLATTLNAMFDRLSRSIGQMRQFTSNAAHELRSPIAAMRAEAEVVLRIPRDADTYRRAMVQTAEETSRLTDLLNQLLMLSRHDAGQISCVEDTVRVDLIILDVVSRLAPFAREKQVRLERPSLPAWQLLGDDILLGQLFFNLIDNAIKYTPAGGSVRIWGHVYGQELVLGVQDTGVGIPESLLSRVFDRFFRVDPSQNGAPGGAGLGLAICRAIVDIHRGRIDVSSVPGEGSCFQVTLPGEIDSEPWSPEEESPEALAEVAE